MLHEMFTTLGFNKIHLLRTTYQRISQSLLSKPQWSCGRPRQLEMEWGGREKNSFTKQLTVTPVFNINIRYLLFCCYFWFFIKCLHQSASCRSRVRSMQFGSHNHNQFSIIAYKGDSMPFERNNRHFFTRASSQDLRTRLSAGREETVRPEAHIM